MFGCKVEVGYVELIENERYFVGSYICNYFGRFDAKYVTTSVA
jgi:hypothetical protein